MIRVLEVMIETIEQMLYPKNTSDRNSSRR
jgi:hypothetical protein